MEGGPAHVQPERQRDVLADQVVAPARLGIRARSARPAPRNSFRRHPPNTCRRSAPSRRSRRRASASQELRNYEVAVERVLNGATIAVRAFEQRIDDQTVTVFGLRRGDAASLGHYYVGAAGDASVRGVGVTFTHALAENIRGSVDYSMATANWTNRAEPVEYAVLTRWIPSAVRPLDRAHSRRDDVARDGDSAVGDARRRALQVEQRVRVAAIAARRRRRSARGSICRSTRRCRS